MAIGTDPREPVNVPGKTLPNGAELDKSGLGGTLPGSYYTPKAPGSPYNSNPFGPNNPHVQGILGNQGDGGVDWMAAIQRMMNKGGLSPPPVPPGFFGNPNASAPAPLSGPPQIPGLGGPGGSGGSGGVGTLEGLDFTKRGALEQYQLDTRDYFSQPTLSEMFAKDAISKGGGNVTNRAEEAYQNFMSSNPANMDPYYENERRKAMEAINKTMAARGSYGSTAANDMIGEAFTNLAADAAMKNAQYGLQRGGLMGSLAQGADQSSLAGSADKRNWTSMLGGLAGQSDSAGLAKVLGGAGVAGSAQGAQRARGQDAFMNQLMMGDRMAGILGSGYGNIFASDMDLFKTGVGLNTGTAAEGYNQASNNATIQRQNVANFNNILGGNLQMGRGLYDMFNTPSPGSQPVNVPGFSGPPADQNYGTTNWYRP